MGDTYLIKSFRGGISDYEDKGRDGAFKFSKNLDIRKVTDSLSCQQALTDDLAAGTFNDETIAIVPASDSNTYFFLKNGRIYKRASNGTYTLVYTDTNAATDNYVTGAVEGYNNVVDTFLYWTTGTRLNRKRILDSSGAAVNTDWSDVNATVNGQTYPKTNLTLSTYHTMILVNGGILGANKDKLFLVGRDESYTTDALKLLPNTVAKTLIERGYYTIIAANRSDNADMSYLFTWDNLSQNWNTRRIIPTASINALIDGEEPIMQVGINGQLFLSEDGNIVPMMSFPYGGMVTPHGVDQDGGLLLFGVYGAGTGKNGIYTYGRKNKNSPSVLNLEYQLECDSIGAIKKIGTNVYIAYKNGTDYGVKKIDTSNKATAVYYSLDLKALPAKDLEGNTWNTINIFTAPLPSGTSIGVRRKLNKSGDWIACNMENGSTSFNTTGAEIGSFLIGDKSNITEIEITLTPSGNNTPEIYKIELGFE